MIIGKKLKELPVSVGVDNEKCVSCHACISACPVKFCNDGSGDCVIVNPYMCIGCGNCIRACCHGARFWIDDFDLLMEDLASGQKIVAIVAPSVTANFPGAWYNLNGWLRSIGIEAVFDVSFGAELTVKSYIELLNNEKKGKTVISQPCPAIVTYIEMYIPELLKYLAPVDSPMLHTMKMIKKYYPKFTEHKIAAISPCLAKKREFHQTGLGDYNIGFISISNYLQKNNINLLQYPKEHYMNPPAERAVGFSSPGGLLKTAERWVPGISDISRKIEGVKNIYPYLEKLEQSIRSGTAPVLVDCLNCEKGCNGGPLTVTEQIPLDDVEMAVNARAHDAISSYENPQIDENIVSQEKINEIVSKFWDIGVYKREYSDLSINNRIILPSEDELKKIYKLMRKNCESDFYNCTACGYDSCTNMAVAIFNGLNRPENCHFFLVEEAKLKSAQISENEKRLRTILSTTSAGFCLADEEFRLIVVNNSFCKTMGAERDKLIGSTLLKKQFERCTGGNGYTSEIRINRPDGSMAYFLFITNPYYDEHKDLVGYFALVIDISKYKHDTGTTLNPFNTNTAQ
ncbi:MAG TPA: [Fe-Fe] hydrogenase large subunit C-terminal domain-containing protein [Chitinispirillaceae bacterium]|nr:[Fe-Fe] hydrogenase large subunit C-terminal domain-containing protein [Chitinispirillaceae bacterium]